MGDAFLGGSSEGGARGFPVFLHTVEEGFEGLVEGVLNHVGVFDIREESGLVPEVKVVGGKSGGGDGTVDGHFHRVEGSYPVDVVGDGDAKNLLDVLVRPLGLAVGLWVVSARTTAFDVEEVAELRPYLGHQARVAVGQEGARKAVKTDDVVKKLVGDDQGSVGSAGFDQVHHLGCTVGEGQDTVVALARGQRHPVHADGLPAAVGELDGLE